MLFGVKFFDVFDKLVGGFVFHGFNFVLGIGFNKLHADNGLLGDGFGLGFGGTYFFKYRIYHIINVIFISHNGKSFLIV